MGNVVSEKRTLSKCDTLLGLYRVIKVKQLPVVMTGLADAPGTPDLASNSSRSSTYLCRFQSLATIIQAQTISLYVNIHLYVYISRCTLDLPLAQGLLERRDGQFLAIQRLWPPTIGGALDFVDNGLSTEQTFPSEKGKVFLFATFSAEGILGAHTIIISFPKNHPSLREIFFTVVASAGLCLCRWLTEMRNNSLFTRHISIITRVVIVRDMMIQGK